MCGLSQVLVTGIECASPGSDTHDRIITVIKDDVMHAILWTTELQDELMEDMKVGHMLMYRLP